jgi:hypothetical protein
MHDPPNFEDGANLDMCGFVCSACAFQMRLSDGMTGDTVIASFKSGIEEVKMVCPECSTESSFTRADLKLFGVDGKVLPFHKTKGTAT